MEKQSTPTKIGTSKKWDGPNGTVYYWDIEFADGTKGQFSTKADPQTKFAEGKPVTYTVETDAKGKVKINVPQKPFGAGSGGGRSFDPVQDANRQKLIVAQNALTNAVSFHNLPSNSVAEILQTADKFFSWTMSHSVEAPKAEPQAAAPAPAGKPTLNDATFNKVLEKINGGGLGILEKTQGLYEIPPSKLKVLQAAEQNYKPTQEQVDNDDLPF